ncbi:hypothetical protein OF83DRAFT_1143441 [Amylostereum chailletii]|nr:hypothetical protein OF83DRAFT_1143441 [Amylostereum chailletii]
MSRLDAILNPENEYEKALRSERRPSPGNSLPSSSSSPAAIPEPNHYADPALQSHEHPSHPSCPNTLNCLPDTEGRPQHTLPIILRCAILGSDKKRFTIREIYAAMEAKYPYYRTAGQTWKQSVRHHLSLNRLFERQPRPVTDPGFGSYWTVNLDAPPGTKRPRKRGRAQQRPPEQGVPGVKKRGRPRKVVPVEEMDVTHPDEHSPIATLPIPNPHPNRLNHCILSTVRSASHPYLYRDEDDDDGTSLDGAFDRVPRLHRIQEEYESEDDMDLAPRYDTPIMHRSPVSGGGSSPRARPPSAHMGTYDDFPENNIIDQLRNEMAGLRQQSTDAIADKRRMGDALADAQSEAARARAAQRRAEMMLREEEKLRREEEELRRQAEIELRELRRKWDMRDSEIEDA